MDSRTWGALCLKYPNHPFMVRFRSAQMAFILLPLLRRVLLRMASLSLSRLFLRGHLSPFSVSNFLSNLFHQALMRYGVKVAFQICIHRVLLYCSRTLVVDSGASAFSNYLLERSSQILGTPYFID